MPLRPSPAHYPSLRERPADPRFLELFGDTLEDADLVIAGVPYDASVLGRKGAAGGPTAIREAMRYLSNHDTQTDGDLIGTRIHDAGDVAGLDENDVLATHDTVTAALVPLFARQRPVVLLGGDHGLTYAHVRALHQARGGRIGIVVIDAHYDLRSYEGQPSSGTPFRRILEELPGDPVAAVNIAEIGIRPFANTRQLADYAAEVGIRVFPMHTVREQGITAVAAEAVELAAEGVDHLWLSVDIDGLDQSIASGCSSPGAGGLWYHEAEEIVRLVAAHPKCRGMDVLEVASNLDPTGSTARTAAQLVATFTAAVRQR